MQGSEPQQGEPRAVTYCLVPRELAPKLHDALRRHFADNPSVEVVVERRRRDQRSPAERRADAGTRRTDRRAVRNRDGRRVGERRATLVPFDAPSAGAPGGLPRKARPFADRLVWVERLEPSAEKLADLDSARLVIQFQSGDQNAFGALYLRYFDRVFSYLQVVFRDDPHEAEDLTQQVFIRVLEALPRYERRAQPFRAWLFRIVRNLAITHLERRGRSDVVEPQEIARRQEHADDGEPALPALDWLTDRELVMFVERLPLPQRQVLILRFMLELTTSEIARVLDRRAADVRTLESRALRFLEQRLTAVGRAPRYERRAEWRRRVSRLPVARQRRYALMR
jgi:RNA polymerase sigma-70 factor (ECF subfamily)